MDISQREDFVGEKSIDVILALTKVMFRFVTSFCLYDMVNGLLTISIGLLGSLEIDFWVEEVGAYHLFDVVHQIKNPVFLLVEVLLAAGSELEWLSCFLDFAIYFLHGDSVESKGDVLFGFFVLDPIELVIDHFVMHFDGLILKHLGYSSGILLVVNGSP